jgi:glycosidase
VKKQFTLVLVGLALSAFAADLPHKVIHATGTFNDWNPADAKYRLTYTGDSNYRVKAFFRAGQYKMKFTVDGDWAINYGHGDGGTVTANGKDIPLEVPRHGAYFIELDLGKRRWWLVPAQMDKPQPVVHILGAVEANIPITLDASESVARDGAIITGYEFGQEKDDPVRAMIEHESPSSSRALVTLPDDGTYHLWAKINDGMASAPEPVTLMAQASYQLVGETTSPLPTHSATAMQRQSPGSHAKVIRPPASGEARFQLIKNHDPNRVLTNVSLQATARGDQFLHIRYDERANELTWAVEDFTEFRYRPADDPSPRARNVKVRTVNLAGSFNNWSTEATPMTDQGDGTFVAHLKLDDGPHQYKFVVNGDIWLEDPKANPSSRVPDGQGGHNSGLFIGLRGEEFGQAPPHDVKMTAVQHRPDQARDFNVVSGDLVEVRLRTLSGDVDRVELRVLEERAWPWSLFLADREHTFPLHRAQSQHGFDYWKATVFLDEPKKELRYYFVLTDGSTTRTLGAEKGKGGRRGFAADLTPRFPTPDWAKNVVWYQIMVDRFRNGSTANDPPKTLPWRWNWYKCAAWEKPVEGKDFSNDWYGRWLGGDLQGLIEKLPYFRELGVTALYLCPIFEANSYHGYDTTDYRHVLSYYGFKDDNAAVIAQETLDPTTWQWTPSDKLFLEFVQKAHAQGLKVVLDGVFNHMGKKSFALQDVLAKGAASPYADWFDVINWGPPVKYRSWDGGGWMPNFRKDNDHGIASPTARKYLFDITRRWMDPNGDGDPSEGIDGWRLDVAPDVPSAFWIEWRKHVKAINPNAYINGEHWGEAPKYLQGDQWDAVMNYQFAIRALRFFADRKRKITATEFDRQLQQLLALYPLQVNMVMQNLYDSHDTDRLANMILNADRDYDQCNRPQDGCPYDGSKPGDEAYRILKLMTTFQMTFLGAPMIWYGNEVGMYGADDPTCRKPMLWKDLQPYDDPREVVSDDVLAHFQRLIAIRNTYPALRTGLFQTLMVHDINDVIAFKRTRNDQVVAVVINNSTRDQTIELPSPFPPNAHVVDLMKSSSLQVRETPMAELGMTDFAWAATVRAIRLGEHAGPALAANDGKLRVPVAAKSAAILVPKK